MNIREKDKEHIRGDVGQNAEDGKRQWGNGSDSKFKLKQEEGKGIIKMSIMTKLKKYPQKIGLGSYTIFALNFTNAQSCELQSADNTQANLDQESR